MDLFWLKLESAVHHGVDGGQEGGAVGYIVSPMGKQRAMYSASFLLLFSS